MKRMTRTERIEARMQATLFFTLLVFSAVNVNAASFIIRPSEQAEEQAAQKFNNTLKVSFEEASVLCRSLGGEIATFDFLQDINDARSLQVSEDIRFHVGYKKFQGESFVRKVTDRAILSDSKSSFPPMADFGEGECGDMKFGENVESTVTGGSCTENKYVLCRFEEKYFGLTTGNETLQQSQSACKKKGGRLARFKTMKEYTNIENLLLFKEGTLSSFPQWTLFIDPTTGEDLDSMKWSDGSPMLLSSNWDTSKMQNGAATIVRHELDSVVTPLILERGSGEVAGMGICEFDTRKIFRFLESAALHDDSKTACGNLGGYLATIRGPMEQLALNVEIFKYDVSLYPHFGLQKLGDTWYWHGRKDDPVYSLSEGAHLYYSNWHYVSTTTSAYGRIYTGSSAKNRGQWEAWNDRERQAICEFFPGYPSKQGEPEPKALFTASDSEMSFEDAREFCAKRGATLAMFRSELEYEQAYAFAASHGFRSLFSDEEGDSKVRYWTGISKLDTSNNNPAIWKYDDGSLFRYEDGWHDIRGDDRNCAFLAIPKSERPNGLKTLVDGDCDFEGGRPLCQVVEPRYWIADTATTWMGGWSLCKEYGGWLATVKWHFHNDAVKKHLGVNDTAWLGLKYRMKDNREYFNDWLWSLDMTSTKHFENWESKDSLGQDTSEVSNETVCAIIQGPEGVWSPEECEEHHRPVCEFPHVHYEASHEYLSDDATGDKQGLLASIRTFTDQRKLLHVLQNHLNEPSFRIGATTSANSSRLVWADGSAVATSLLKGLGSLAPTPEECAQLDVRTARVFAEACEGNCKAFEYSLKPYFAENECAIGTHNCDHDNAYCINSEDSFDCHCYGNDVYSMSEARQLRTEDDVGNNRTCIPPEVLFHTTNSQIMLEALVDRGSYDVVVQELDALRNQRSPVVGGLGKFNLDEDNNYAHVIPRRLPSGFWYHAKVVVNPHEAHINNDKQVVLDSDVRVACGCRFDKFNIPFSEEIEKLREGRPRRVRAHQQHGFVRLQWKGDSMCAEGFSLGRREISYDDSGELTKSSLSSFTSTFLTIGADECGRHFAPGREAGDDIGRNELKINSMHEYCVDAVSISNNVPSYRSGGTCTATPLKIFFESELRVLVHLGDELGRLPVGHVEVSWRLLENPASVPTAENGSHVEIEHASVEGFQGKGKTSEDGYLRIHLGGSPYHDAEVLPLELTFEKTLHTPDGEEVRHEFQCPSAPDEHCNNTIVMVQHLDFSREVEILDVTSSPMTGKISFRNTDGLCGVQDVEVCLEGVDGKMVDTCTTTDADGMYYLAAPYSIRARPAVGDFFNHSFVRSGMGHESFLPHANGFIQVEEGREYHHMDFVDVTDEHVMVQLAGGECNMTFFERARFQVKISTCPEWQGVEIEQTEFDRSHQVPAAHLEIKLSGIFYGPTDADYDSKAVSYFQQAGDSRKVDLVSTMNADRGDDGRYHIVSNPTGKESARQVRFEYHPPPQLEISFVTDNKEISTMQQQIDLNCVGSARRWVLPELEWAEAHIKVTEMFMIGSCAHVQTVVNVENGLGVLSESEVEDSYDHLDKEAKESLTSCPLGSGSSCEVDTVPNSDSAQNTSESVAQFKMFTGPPSLVDPFTKIFRVYTVNEHHAGAEDAFSEVELEVVIIGSKLLSNLFSVPVPLSKPLATVRDPPGGNSFAKYTNVRSHYSIQVGQKDAFEQESDIRSDSNDLSTRINAASLGIQSIKVGYMSESNDNHRRIHRVDHQINRRTTTLTVEWSMETASQRQSRPGRDSDMLLLPSLILRYLRVGVVSFSVSECKETYAEDIQYAIGKSNNVPGLPPNDEGFAWVSVHDIEKRILPELNDMMADASDTHQEEEIAKAISDYQLLLHRHDNPEAVHELGVVPTQFLDDLEDERGAPPAPATEQPIFKDSNPIKVLRKKVAKIKFSLSKGIYFGLGNDGEEEIDTGSMPGFEPKKEVPGPKSYDTHKSIALAPVSSLEQVLQLRSNKRFSDSEIYSLRKAKTITFNGGGSVYSMEMKFSSLTSEEGGGKFPTSTVSKTEGDDSKLYLMAPGESDIREKGTHHVSVHSFTTGDVDDDRTFSFSLSDPEVGDVFDVTLAKDQDGFFLFNTTGGQSSCLPEEGTYPRTQPQIEILRSPREPAHPENSYIYEVRIYDKSISSNSGRRYEIFNANLKGCRDGAKIKVGGRDLTSSLVIEEGLGPGSDAENLWYTLVEISRGEEYFSYPELKLGIRPECNGLGRENFGSINNQSDTYIVDIPAEFYEECPKIELSAPYSRTVSANSGMVFFDFHNHDGAARKWSTIHHVESVWVQYRIFREKEEQSDWIDLPEGNLSKIEAEGNGFGFARYTLDWKNSLPLDGRFSIRGKVSCSVGAHQRDSLRFATSEVATVTVDTQQPVLFGAMRPVSEVWRPGRSIGASYTEHIECNRPFPFDVSLKLTSGNTGQTPFVFTEQSLSVICNGRDLELAFPYRIRFRDMMGLQASLSISNVQDLAGNSIPFPNNHNFIIDEPDAAELVVDVKDVKVHIEEALASENNFTLENPITQNVTDHVRRYIAEERLLIPVARLKINTLTLNETEGIFHVSLRVTPPSTSTSSQRLRMLEDDALSTEILDVLVSMGGEGDIYLTPEALDKAVNGNGDGGASGHFVYNSVDRDVVDNVENELTSLEEVVEMIRTATDSPTPIPTKAPTTLSPTISPSTLSPTGAPSPKPTSPPTSRMATASDVERLETIGILSVVFITCIVGILAFVLWCSRRKKNAPLARISRRSTFTDDVSEYDPEGEVQNQDQRQDQAEGYSVSRPTRDGLELDRSHVQLSVNPSGNPSGNPSCPTSSPWMSRMSPPRGPQQRGSLWTPTQTASRQSIGKSYSPASKPGQHHWTAVTVPEAGGTYYVNTATGEWSWENPAGRANQ